MLEKEMYDIVEKWATKKLGRLIKSIIKGTDSGRVDVVGRRPTPGDRLSQTNLTCIEANR